jgi:sec-independent protein translocase protein TatA
MLFTEMPFAIFGMPGQYELLIIAGLALLFFGNRLPGMMRSLGSGVNEFKKGMKEGESDDEEGDAEKPPKKPEKAAKSE